MVICVTALATPNAPRLDLRTMVLREYGRPGGIPTLVDAPHAGHTAMIADYHKGESPVETLLANGIDHVLPTDWKSATEEMKDLEIDNYLAEIVVAIDDLGGRANLAGRCQGGWISAMIAARFPEKVNSLVLAGAPIDTDAGSGVYQAHGPRVVCFVLRGAGGSRRRADEGQVHASGLEEHAPGTALHSGSHRSVRAHRRVCLSGPKRRRSRAGTRNPIDLPGRWYLQVITQLFKENRLAKGEFIGLGRRLNLHNITCPVYLLAGADDDITTPEGALAADRSVAWSPDADRRGKSLIHFGIGGVTLQRLFKSN
jgi:pimeloyl-ACP methyl ester carboxylesterase